MRAVCKVGKWPVFDRSDRYFTANSAKAGKRPAAYFRNQCMKSIFRKRTICSDGNKKD